MIRINCDMCGSVDDSLLRAIVEGVELNVCSACGKFGKVLGPVKKPIIKQAKKTAVQEKEDTVELLVENFQDIIKKGRESKGLSQKDFALRLNVKESVIHHIETGNSPNMDLARKLERMLKVRLVEDYEEKHEIKKLRKLEGFTLGDFIKLKK